MDGVSDRPVIEVVPSGTPLGAEIKGVDVTKIDAAHFTAIRQALHDHQVILFRDQDIDDPQFLEFARFFGEIDMPRKTRIDNDPWIPEYPEIIVVSNLRDDDGKAMGALGAGEAFWHADMTYLDEVPLASLLYALEIPDHGGETGFSNQRMAFETMPDDLLSRIAERELVHDHVHNSTGAVTPNWEEQDSPLETPGAHHPIVVHHHATGRKHLMLGRRPHALITGMEIEESEALLDELWAHATQEKFVWRHDWKAGDLIVWDNWCTLHHRNPFDDSQSRIMHRTQIKGVKPN
ncbi:MAG: TauD/TfdA family dioxygenase [Alphaproteobacteria bacterium]|jgi:taurine dioxygenase|nr:TauD/TfdA family dioxygenase [Alphaproteobacteria bacterium]